MHAFSVYMYHQYIHWYVNAPFVAFLPNPSTATFRQSSSDLPLLANVRNLATRLLASLLPASTPVTPSTAAPPAPLQSLNNQFRIGFITPPFKDNKIPVTDHLHAHAFIGPADLTGWWRGIAYGPLAWYAIEDLIAEIRCDLPLALKLDL
jgi:hypothetical protein